MKRVKSVLSAVPAAVVIVAVLFAASCSYDLLPEPEIEQVQGVAVNKDAQIEAPLTVKATQGKTRVVTISWSTSNGATQYIIYSAASPHEEFLQIAETKGEVNSIDIQAAAGTSAYYRVCARDYKKEISGFSDTVFGSTMATPIISGITSSADGTSATVSWWMENCSASTYQSLVNYVVYCYDESGDEVTSATASGKQTSAVLSGLTANTRYFYQVEAFISADQSNPELSDKVDEETARRLIPDAPENLSATRGTDKTTMAISWTLPPFCDVVVSGGVYDRHPLYFTVERKPKGDDDTKYQKIVAYLGTQKASDGASVIQFSCAADGAATNKDGVVSVQPTSDADAERSDNYPNYISCSTITYYDTTAERGVQYEYRVQSYVDAVKKTISAEEAAAVTEGFLLSKPSFSASPYYHKVDGSNAITNITVSFRVVFEPYGQDYNYILCRNYEPMETENGLTGTSVSDHKVTTAGEPTLNGKTDVFDFSAKDFDIGYYQYVLYICASGENDIAKAYDSITMSGKITVIDDASKLPTITRFDIEDGYAGKFRLTWNYDSACRYRLEWTSSLDGFTKVEKLPMDNENFTQENGFATYDHTAVSGERRFYTLVANGGIEVSKTYPLPKDGDAEVPEPQELATLGTAEPRTVGIDYRTISVSWPKVQRATDDFGIKAYYEGTSETALATGTYKIEDRDDYYYCVITNPNGYDDPKRSGLPITMEITAKSDKTGDTTTKTHTVRTLGPAEVGAKVNTFAEATEDSISLSWNKVEGANGYLIRRVMYGDAAMQNVADGSGVTYYCDASGKVTLIDADGTLSGRIEPSNDGEKLKLVDKYKETDSNIEYEKAQAKIAWGLPFRYVILPVLNSDDFDFESNSLALDDNKSKVKYTGLEPTGGAATFGYGLNVHAKKSESATTQNVTWEKPFYGDENLTPKVYRRKFANNDKDDWEALNSTPKDCEINYSPSGKDRYCAWEYVVKYQKNTSDEIAPSYLEWLNDNDHDETSYDYGSATKEKLNKGYLLAMNYIASYGGEGTSKGHDYYYSEDVTITPWYYNDRTLGPDKVELKVCSFDLADGWQSVGVLDPEITGFTEKKTLTDTTVSDVNLGTIKLKPTGISGGTKSTTDGPLKILRSAKHYYGLDLSCDGNEEFDCKNYEEYAYRQITDEELVRAATLAMSVGIKHSMPNDGWARTNDPSNSWTGSSGSVTTRWYAREWEWGQGEHHIHTTEFVKFITYLTCKFGDNVSSFLQIDGEIQGKIKGSVASSRPPHYYSGTITVKNILTKEGGITIKFNDAKKDSTKEIELTRNGTSLNFGNITPLPYEGQGDNGFLNDSEEWQ